MNRFISILAFVLLVSCETKSTMPAISPEAHREEVEKWFEKRVEDLRGLSGWLNLAGLYWLKEGVNTFGSAPDNDVVFPNGKIAEHAGYFLVKDGVVTLEASTVADIKGIYGGVTRETVYHPDSVSRTPMLEHGTLLWFVIKRDDRFAVRLRDFESEGLSKFKGIERYPVDLKWRVSATLEAATPGKTIDITNIVGQTTAQVSPGTLVFEIDGKECRLDAIKEIGDDLFVIFADPTNLNETYPAGRYIYVKPPDATGQTVIDFNKAYNPPCAFTTFATCPLPPRQNVLDVAITAGERKYDDPLQHH